MKSSEDELAYHERRDTTPAESLKSTFSNYAETYADLDFEIKKGERVLDFGCGIGCAFVPDDNGKSLIQTVGTTGRVVGVDINATNIKKAAERILGYIKKNKLQDYYALLVLQSAKELQYTKQFLHSAIDAKLLDPKEAEVLWYAIDNKEAPKETIQGIERKTGKRLIILYHTDATEVCPQNYFDKIIERRVLQNMSKPFEALKNCALALKKGGVAYFTYFLVWTEQNKCLFGTSLLKSIKGIEISEKHSHVKEPVFRLKKIGNNKDILRSKWPETKDQLLF